MVRLEAHDTSEEHEDSMEEISKADDEDDPNVIIILV